MPAWTTKINGVDTVDASHINDLQKHIVWETLEYYGALGNGTTDDSAALLDAVTDAATAGKGLVINGAKTYYVPTTVALPAADLEIRGIGHPVFTTDAGNSIFKQTAHGYHNVFDGLKFTGDGKGIEYDSADEVEEFYEYDIRNCIFSVDAGVYNVYLVGAREGTISRCYFITGDGIYRSHSNICLIDKSIFKSTQTQVGTAIFDNGLGVAYSCGLQIKSSVIIGYEYGVKASETDDIHIEGCTIDYNTYNIQLLGQDTGTITGNYLGSVGAEPALKIDVSGAVRSGNLLVSNNKFVGHSTANPGVYDCVSITDADYCQVRGNYIAFYTRYGIYYHGCTVLSISHNDIIPRGGLGVKAIYTDEDNQSNKVCWNTYTTYGHTLGLAQEWENYTIGSARTSPVDYLMHANAQVADLLMSGSPEFAELDVWGNARVGVIDGAEIAVNGGFASDAANWTATDCTLASVAGGQAGNCLQMTRTGATFQTAAQTNAGFVVSHKYRYTCYVKSGTSGAEIAYLIARPDTATDATYDTTGYAVTSGTWTQITITFTATETSYDILLIKGSATAGTMLFDTMSAVELIPLVDAGHDASGKATLNGQVNISTLGSYANDAAAGADGLESGDLYTVTGSDPLQLAIKS